MIIIWKLNFLFLIPTKADKIKLLINAVALIYVKHKTQEGRGSDASGWVSSLKNPDTAANTFSDVTHLTSGYTL